MSECNSFELSLLPFEPMNDDLIKVFHILNKADRQLLAERYSELKFINDLHENYKCVQCSQISFSHYIGACGHVYCEICKGVYTMHEDEIWTCPKCFYFDQEITHRNAGLELKILSLFVSCPNSSKGCTFTTILMEMPKHIRECDKTLDKKIVTDPVTVALKQLKNELEGKLNYLEWMYTRMQQTIMLLMSSESRKLCLAFQAQRNYVNVKAKVINDTFNYINNSISQLSDEEILKKLKETETKKQQIVHVQENFNSSFQPKQCFIPSTSTVYTWVIADVFQLKKGDGTVTFPLNGQPVSAQVNLRYTFGRLDFQYKATSNFDNLATPFPRVTFTLRFFKNSEDIIEDEGISKIENKHSEKVEQLFSKIVEIEFKQPYEYNCSFDRNVLKNANGSLTVFISIDFPRLIENPMSLNGTLCWKIRNFAEIINNSEGSCDMHYSPYFYSEKRGFRMNVELNAAYLSRVMPVKAPFCRMPLTVRFLTGENDHFLPDDFEIDFSVGVLNQHQNLIPIDRATATDSYCNLSLLTFDQMKQYLNEGTLCVIIVATSVN